MGLIRSDVSGTGAGGRGEPSESGIMHHEAFVQASASVEGARRVNERPSATGLPGERACGAGAGSVSGPMQGAASGERTEGTPSSTAPVIATYAQATVTAPSMIPKPSDRTAVSIVTAEPRNDKDLLDINSLDKNYKQVTSGAHYEWQTVQSKSAKRYKLTGQRGRASLAPDIKFKAADVKVPLFISNVSKDTSEQDILSYIKGKTNEIVSLKMIKMKSNKKYNAYKLFVSRSNLNLFLNDEFWPNGITFRRFVHFMYENKRDNVIVN